MKTKRERVQHGLAVFGSSTFVHSSIAATVNTFFCSGGNFPGVVEWFERIKPLSLEM